MPEHDWMLEENCNEGIRQDGLRQKAQRLKEYNYAHESAFSAYLNKARRER